MFVREETERALAEGQDAQSVAGIDDPDHLRAFIEEVRGPADSLIPNRLFGFSEISEVMEKVLANLNLGRNLWESFVRYAVVSELTANLSLVTRRLKTTAVPRRKNMESVRRTYAELGPDALSASLVLSDQDRTRLAVALVHSDPVASLSNEAIKQAVNGGVFLTIDSATGGLSETTMHRELVQAMKSVKLMRGFESSNGEHITRLVADLIPSSNYSGMPDSWTVRKQDFVISFRYYDWMDDLFNRHLAICEALILGQPDPAPYQRSPVTPTGEIESARILAVRVSPTELKHLITNQILPFGMRVMPEPWGSTEEAQI